MTIKLNTYTFDPEHTSVKEKVEEVGGKDERRFVLSGLIAGKSTVADVEAELDRILDEASMEDYGAKLSLRDNREFSVERAGFERRIDEREALGAFTLELVAADPFECATTETSGLWDVTSSGQTTQKSAGGNVYSKPRFALTATGNVVDPVISDGTRTIKYSGTVADGEVLVFDAEAETATLENEDVLPYTTGEFPRIAPEATTLTYTDDAASSHTASIQIAFRDRWW